ncbi:probable LRR receptor-like serine/threonine-protein kinase At3g47570 [Camellia sinensis]|uniref:probable LRR receptor-like serine/threonine-protein kinase At3g47570 n=1 Tax=Camellia sinensis TaxID=4442 RepID=UPI0010358496|nr:probable LRR receptor-like serine/threonine-protein kinase At3g47570 [Camellia sinensis]
MGNGINETDQLALLALKSQITDDPFKLFTSWNDSVHFCQWNGVTCGRRHHQRVVLLDLWSLKLSGNISPYIVEVANLKNLGYLSVSSNMLSGEIPGTLGRCVMLETLYMDGNFFQGTIPSTLASLRVPTKGIFANASAISVNGNSKLCGGVPELQLSLCNSIRSQKRRLTLASKLAISICSGVLGVSFMLSILYICWYRKAEKDLSSVSLKKSLLKVSYQTLLKATDGFSSGNLIGVSSFGSMYRGILEHDGTIVAMKVLNLRCPGASKSFLAKCKAWRNIKHRKLVKVLTACSGVDYQGNDFKALVYDFMVNGSLEDWLHPVTGLDLLHNEPKKLGLHQRLNISIEVACALDYLHHDYQTPIIHCDLKPSNILLNEDMIGHVGDFGLARFLQEANHNFNAKQGSSTGVRGTIGYTAPEYGMGSEVTTKGDVYSYGILLLEMFMGKRPTDDMFKDSLNLHNFVKMALPYPMVEVADPMLLWEVEEKTLDIRVKTQEFLISILQIGVTCSRELSKERMNISDVVAGLHSIKSIFLATVHSEQII